MKKTEDKIKQLENQILENHVNEEKELLITEMKKIGIEKLPYSYSALKQFIDPETMNFHYNKHYKGYVDKLNDALSKKKYGDLDLEKIIKTISRFDKTIRNNAGGAFNHALFWNMLTPEPKKLDGELYKKITKQWGTFTNFKKEFEKQAKDRFGSGWVWLILTSKNSLKIMSTPNQDNPLMNVIEGGGFPLLGLDLWEHAYYLKYKNKKDEYITNFWKVVNWDFVSKMYEMRVETKLTESVEMKKLMTEAKSEKCSQDEVEACKMLFNVNKKIKFTYQHGIDEILREVFQDKYVAKPNNDELPGIYDLEKEGRSVINKLNTNYNTFCIIMKDLNSVITKETKKPPINYDGKTPAEQVKETERFVSVLKYFAYRIFNTQSSTFINVMKVLEEKDKVGDKREKITASILRRHFGKRIKIDELGKLGNKQDALSGIDLVLYLDGERKTAQVKPFVDKIDKGKTYTMIGTGQVKPYTTDYMVFQKGKNVLVFENNPKILDGAYVFPVESLVYDIQ